MPSTCENWLCLVNSCIYHACQTHDIYQVLPYSVDFKAPRELWNPLGKTVLSNCSFIWNKGPVKSQMMIKLKGNLHVGPVDIFVNFWHWYHHERWWGLRKQGRWGCWVNLIRQLTGFWSNSYLIIQIISEANSGLIRQLGFNSIQPDPDGGCLCLPPGLLWTLR